MDKVTDKEMEAIIEKLLAIGHLINEMVWDLIALSRKLAKK